MPHFPTQAAALLQEWEVRAQPDPAAYASQRPALLEMLTEFCSWLDARADVNLDVEDLRTVFRAARALGLARATAAGADRATRAAQALLTALAIQQIAGHERPAAILLNISSPDNAELEMDELVEITHTVQQHLGTDADMIFGHGLHPAAADEAGLRLWLLVGYAPEAPAPTLRLPPVIRPGPPLAATGRDVAFAAAAGLVVFHQQASASLLQRHLKLGYDRSYRVMQQLAQAGVIGPGGAGAAPFRVLLADEIALARVLTHLPRLAS